MIPILYDANLADAWTISNGIGRLSDVISCNVVEERNGAYTMSMTYPIDGVHANDILTNRIIKCLAGDKTGIQCFRIRSIAPSFIKGQINVLCNHVSYDLSYYPVRPFTANVDRPATALTLLWYNAINQNPFLVDPELYVLPSLVKYGIDEPASTKSLLMGQSGSILDLFGGEFEWDNRKVIWKRERGTDTGINIAYGKNLVSYDQETNISETVCGILPVWKSKDSVVYGDIQYSDNASDFPFPKTQVIDFSDAFDPENPPSVSDLNSKAAAYNTANEVGHPVISTKIEFFPRWQTPEYKEFKDFERVGLCDTVTVLIPQINAKTKAKVVKTDFNVLLERYNSVELGTVKKTVADVIAGML